MRIDIIEQLKQDIENTSNYEEIFEIYSEKLINNYALKFENKIYNFVEIEFCFYDKRIVMRSAGGNEIEKSLIAR